MAISITAIIPAYNAERFISISIDSILKQTIPIDEIIVINDGSKDNTSDFVRKKYPSVIVIDQANAGPSKARNTGILKSKCDYITFLDADDEWHSEMIEHQKRFFSENPEIHWWASNYSMNKWSESVGKSEFSQIIQNPLQYFGKELKIWTGAVVVRKDALIRVDCFDENLGNGEDIDLWIKLQLAYPKLGYTGKCLAKYNDINSSSITSINTKKYCPKTNDLKRKYLINETFTSQQEYNYITSYFTSKIQNEFINSLVYRNFHNCWELYQISKKNRITKINLGTVGKQLNFKIFAFIKRFFF